MAKPWVLPVLIAATAIGVSAGTLGFFAFQYQTRPTTVEEYRDFKEALALGQKAAELAQTAKSAEEWQSVFTAWSDAKVAMIRIPASSPNYDDAQQRVQQYGKNQDYARLQIERNGGNQEYAQQNTITAPTYLGLGISRRSIQSRFQSSGVDFTFENSSPVNGQPRVMGQSRNKLAILELTGESENLSMVTMLVAAPPDDSEATTLASVYLLGILKLAAPELANPSDWLITNLNHLTSSGDSKTSTVVADKKLTLSVVRDIGFISLTIKPNQ